MRFGTGKTPPRSMGRAFQMRITLMIVALGLVVLGIKVASNPNFWARWFPDETADSAAVAGTDSRENAQPSPQRLHDDEILLAQRTGTDSEVGPDRETEDTDESALPELPERPETVGIDIDQDRLLDVEDNSVGIAPEEAEAFYYLLDHAARVPLGEFHAAGQDDLSRETLLAAPARYRGTPVTIEGEIRRNLPASAGPNVYDITRYFSSWVIVPYSSKIPWHVVALNMDGRIPVGESISESVPVRITGYFFKIQGYKSEEGIQVAPVLIANKIELAPVSAPAAPAIGGEEIGLGIFISFCVIFAIAAVSVWIYTRNDRTARRWRKESLESDGDLSNLQGRSAVDPVEHLEQIGDEPADAPS